jgi:hypothetical protein
MTALADWLSNTLDPRHLTTLIRETIGGPADEDEPSVVEPVLISPGIERC